MGSNSWEEWLEAYEASYGEPEVMRRTACPNCGQSRLSLVFTERAANGDGYASFWCDSCLQGIHISRAVIPERAVVNSGKSPDSKAAVIIPNYTVVWPAEANDADVESEVF